MPIDGPAQIAKAEALIDDLYYRTVKATTLRSQLLCAREGCLDIDWRTALVETAAEPIEGIAEKHQQIRERAARDVTDLSDADWEPENGFLEHVQSLQPHLQGDTAAATQGKAGRLNEAGIALMKELAVIGERVGHSATAYVHSDQSGHAIVAASAGQAF